jgi:type II secretory pathway pseudopilin PulG
VTGLPFVLGGVLGSLSPRDDPSMIAIFRPKVAPIELLWRKALSISHIENENFPFEKGIMALRRMCGFSLVELGIVMAIGMIAAVFTMVTVQPALRQVRVTNGYNSTLMTLRRAREQAVAERRVYLVTLTAPRTLTVTQIDTGLVTLTATLPTDVSFDAEPGIPSSPTGSPTTPDGFGTGVSSGPIDFDIGVGGGGTNTVYFYPDGTARDVNGVINNGVVYVARTGDLLSSRAITVWGLTGRIRGWRLYKNSSAGTNYWSQQ